MEQLHCWAVLATLAALAATACNGDDGGDGTSNLSGNGVRHIVTGPRCTEYSETPEMNLTSNGPCPERLEEGGLCWVCRDAEPSVAAAVGTQTFSYYQYDYDPVTKRMVGCGGSNEGDSCVVGLGGKFEAVGDDVTGPSGLERETLVPGEPSAGLGVYAFSVPQFSPKDGKMGKCNNIYGDVAPSALDIYPPAPCPDDNRCATGCAITSQTGFGQMVHETIVYDYDDACSSMLKSEQCEKAGGKSLEY